MGLIWKKICSFVIDITKRPILSCIRSLPSWHDGMERILKLLVVSEGNPPVTGKFPLQRVGRFAVDWRLPGSFVVYQWILTAFIFCCMMTSSNGNIFRVTGHLCREFTGHRWIPRTKASDTDVFFDLRLNKRLSKQWWGWWFETPLRPLWRHFHVLIEPATALTKQAARRGILKFKFISSTAIN